MKNCKYDKWGKKNEKADKGIWRGNKKYSYRRNITGACLAYFFCKWDSTVVVYLYHGIIWVIDMKKIINEHTGAIRAFVISILILGILFGRNMRWSVSEVGKVENDLDYSEYSVAVQQVLSGAAPELYFDNGFVIYAGNATNLPTMFWVKYDEKEESVKANEMEYGQFEIKSIENMGGENITSLYHADTGVITFPKAGIYRITVSVTDSESRQTTVTINIPVEEGEEL